MIIVHLLHSCTAVREQYSELTIKQAKKFAVRCCLILWFVSAILPGSRKCGYRLGNENEPCAKVLSAFHVHVTTVK